MKVSSCLYLRLAETQAALPAGRITSQVSPQVAIFWFLGSFQLAAFKVCVVVIIANTMEQCSLFLPLLRGAGPMALMLWLNG
jgi:hypothetical protein